MEAFENDWWLELIVLSCAAFIVHIIVIISIDGVKRAVQELSRVRTLGWVFIFIATRVIALLEGDKLFGEARIQLRAIVRESRGRSTPTTMLPAYNLSDTQLASQSDPLTFLYGSTWCSEALNRRTDFLPSGCSPLEIYSSLLLGSHRFRYMAANEEPVLDFEGHGVE